jgi:hypothetical protein
MEKLHEILKELKDIEILIMSNVSRDLLEINSLLREVSRTIRC